MMFPIAVAVACFVGLLAGEPTRDLLLQPPFKQNSPSPSSLGIIGGEPARLEDHPWMVSVQFNNRHRCAGSIISESFILTTGSCADHDASNYTIRTGSEKIHEGGVVIQVSEIILHEDYSESYDVTVNDISLLKLAEKISFSHSAQPVYLPDQGEAAPDGVLANVTGWGFTDQDVAEYSDVLRVLEIPLIDVRTCRDAYKNFGDISKGQICAGYFDDGRSLCFGDGGDPLVIDKRLYGLSAWGNYCAETGYPTVFTEVAYYRDWIAKYAKV